MKPNSQNKKAAIPALFLILMLGASAGCQDKTLQQSAVELNKILKTNRALQEAVIEANRAGLLTDDQARPVIGLTRKVAEGALQANSIIEGLSKLGPNQKVRLSQILEPLNAAVQSLDPDLLAQIASIKNPTTQASVATLVSALKTSLTILTTNFGGGSQ